MAPEVGSTTPYARYVGRVGALAVALGVGMAIATGQGLGIARAETDQPTDSQSTNAPSATEKAVDESADPTVEAHDPSDPPEPADPTVDAHDPSGPPESGQVLDSESVPEMNYDSSGGLVEADDDDSDVSSDDEPSGDGDDQEAESEEPAPTSSVSSPQAPDLPEPSHDSAGTSDDVVVQHDSTQTKPSAPGGDADRASRRQDVAERDEVNAAPDPDQRGLSTGQELSSGQQLMTAAAHEPVRTAAEVESREPAAASLPGAMLSYATNWVGAVFSAFLAPSPASPPQPPLFWAVLTWAGREVQQTLANRPSIGVVETLTTSAIAATPYEEATALIEQARSFEDQADTQRDLAAQIYRAELRKADGLWAQAATRYADAQTQLRAGQLDAARARIEAARSFEQQAQVQRALAGQIQQAELAKARGLFAQAENRRLAAQQLFQQAGFPREAQAARLRLQGHRLRWDAALSADQAAFDRQLAAAAGDRARAQRQTAWAIRTSTSDVGLQTTATQLSQQATANDREAARLALGATGLELRGQVARALADLHFRLADLLNPNGH